MHDLPQLKPPPVISTCKFFQPQHRMIAVVDTNYFIDKEPTITDITRGYIPQSVKSELIDKLSAEFYSLYSFKIDIRDPKPCYVTEVREATRNKHYNLSEADTDVVALVLELSDERNMQWQGADGTPSEDIVCLTRDNGIKSALQSLGLCTDLSFQERRYKLRCYACFTLHEKEVDFCKKCGYNTLTRVTVIGEGADEQVLLKENYRYRPKVLKDGKGNIFYAADQREYIQYKDRQKRQHG